MTMWPLCGHESKLQEQNTHWRRGEKITTKEGSEREGREGREEGRREGGKEEKKENKPLLLL